MAAKTKTRDFEQVVGWLREHGFDVLEAPGSAKRVFLKKYGCSAAIESKDHSVSVFAHPGYLVAGEIAKLVDRGYQKFLKTSKTEIAATADHLKAIHQFSEELKEAMGAVSIYSEGLGTVSDAYVYDRVKDREAPEAARPHRPWQK